MTDMNENLGKGLNAFKKAGSRQNKDPRLIKKKLMLSGPDFIKHIADKEKGTPSIGDRAFSKIMSALGIPREGELQQRIAKKLVASGEYLNAKTVPYNMIAYEPEEIEQMYNDKFSTVESDLNRLATLAGISLNNTMVNENPERDVDFENIHDIADYIEDLDLSVSAEEHEAFQDVLSSHFQDIDPENELTIKYAVIKLGLERAKRLVNDLMQFSYDYDLEESKQNIVEGNALVWYDLAPLGDDADLFAELDELLAADAGHNSTHLPNDAVQPAYADPRTSAARRPDSHIGIPISYKQTLGWLDTVGATILDESNKSKPDFLDIDGDGDKEEPMKKAAKDKNVSEEMREWANSVDQKYEDRGTEMEQPEGETVDLSLRRYLDANAQPVQVTEDHTTESMMEAYKEFKK